MVVQKNGPITGCPTERGTRSYNLQTRTSLQSCIATDDAARSAVFNSFFYKRLSVQASSLSRPGSVSHALWSANRMYISRHICFLSLPRITCYKVLVSHVYICQRFRGWVHLLNRNAMQFFPFPWTQLWISSNGVLLSNSNHGDVFVTSIYKRMSVLTFRRRSHGSSL